MSEIVLLLTYHPDTCLCFVLKKIKIKNISNTHITNEQFQVPTQTSKIKYHIQKKHDKL